MLQKFGFPDLEFNYKYSFLKQKDRINSFAKSRNGIFKNDFGKILFPWFQAFLKDRYFC